MRKEFPDVVFRRRTKNGRPTNKMEVSIKTKRQVEFEDKRKRLKDTLFDEQQKTNGLGNVKRYIGGLQELLRETQSQLSQMNPRGSTNSSHANLTHKARINVEFEKEL